MPDYTIYDATVTLLTPLHIGSGRELLHEYDYSIRNGRTWRIKEDALLDKQKVDDLALAEQLARTPPAQLLRAEDYRLDGPLFRYVVRGTPRSRAKGAQVREQLKDAHDRPYLPGTSLKGALRTALAWHAWGELGTRPERSRLNRSPRFAAQRYERDLFGRNPNHDLLRALHVGDSAPVQTDRLMLVNARVVHRGGAMGSPIELEAVRPETRFQATLKLDRALFTDWAQKRGLHLRGQAWLEHLARTVQAHTAQRLETESAWYSSVEDARAVRDFYRDLGGARLPEGAFLLQLGWGTGWDDKTLGSRLRADERFLEGVIGQYRLARGQRRRGDPFPKSRRVLVQVRRSASGQVIEEPASPLGWVLVELRPRAAREPTVGPSGAPGQQAHKEVERVPQPPRQEDEPPAVTERARADVSPPKLEAAPEEKERVVPQMTEALLTGPGTGTVVRYNMAQGRGTIIVDGSDVEVEVRATDLRTGVRYLAAGTRVSFVVENQEGRPRLRDVEPA